MSTVALSNDQTVTFQGTFAVYYEFDSRVSKKKMRRRVFKHPGRALKSSAHRVLFHSCPATPFCSSRAAWQLTIVNMSHDKPKTTIVTPRSCDIDPKTKCGHFRFPLTSFFRKTARHFYFKLARFNVNYTDVKKSEKYRLILLTVH